MDLSIVIVNWNTRRLLAQCLESLAADSRSFGDGCVEIWVVDNASNDGSIEMVRERFPQVHLVENRENLGFARANNQAIRQSNGRYVLLLNPDTVVGPGALAGLVHFMDAHEEAGAAGARLFNPDGSLQISCYPAPTLSREFWRLFHLDKLRPYGSYRMSDWDVNQPRQVDILLGACLLLRRQVLDRVGLLDEDYFVYSEEVDLCTRVQRAGWRLYWVPQAELVHYGGQSTQQVALAMFLQLYRGKLLYFRKHYGQVSAQVYKLILLTAALTRIVLSPLAYFARPSQGREKLELASRYGHLIRVLVRL